MKVNRVELQDITPPDSVLSAMEKQMQAERNKRAQILTSEGQKAAEILASEGERTAIVNKAEAAKHTPVQLTCSVVSNSLQPQGRLPSPSPTPRVCSNSCPLSW